MGPARRIESEARACFWEEFRRRGIVIPFPIRTLEISRPTHVDAVPTAALVVVAGVDAGIVFALSDASTTVGRGAFTSPSASPKRNTNKKRAAACFTSSRCSPVAPSRACRRRRYLRCRRRCGAIGFSVDMIGES